jgi:sodium transport system permease protein
MNWNNVRLIFLRELRDQMRDRRTLFTIAVLPILLYPLLGMAMLQIQQFLKNESRVRVVGADALPDDPPLLVGDHFAASLYSGPQELLTLQIEKSLADGSSDDAGDKNAQPTPALSQSEIEAAAQRDIRDGKYDLLVYFPPDFNERLAEFRQKLVARQTSDGDADSEAADADDSLTVDQVPGPQLFKNTAIERSQLAHDRVAPILGSWRESIVGENLRQTKVSPVAIRPFEVDSHDVAEPQVRRVMVWSKLLPLVVLIWALTGAFYPAIDLCAGEKERGTLETLLSSAAQRSEIVWGKLLTVMTFSMATALLNLASLGFTGRFVANAFAQMGPQALGPPPFEAVGWLVLALVPVAALFSALSLAIASFARSSKEGQYYLMPLLLGSLPLMMLPMLPSVELNVGFSLIPVTGVMLLLRSLIEGQYWDALRYAPLVIGVTGVCCLLAIRWAIDQFNDESVLFRESERFGLKLWVQHLIRDRGDTPTVGEALLCGVLLLVIRFFASFSMSQPNSWPQFAMSTIIVQVALIATPACLMAIMLTRKPLQTLLLRRPSFWITVPAAALLAMLLHPSTVWIGELIQRIYPVNQSVEVAIKEITEQFNAAPLWQLLAIAALSPAICEELAFRGFILSGLRKMGHKWGAIVLCSVFFGLAHSLLQQSLAACVVGIVIGYIAVKTGSLLPAAMYHLTHNGLSVASSRLTPEVFEKVPLARQLWETTEQNTLTYTTPATIAMALLGVGVLLWFKSLPYHASDEERLQEALNREQPLTTAKPPIPAGDSP